MFPDYSQAYAPLNYSGVIRKVNRYNPHASVFAGSAHGLRHRRPLMGASDDPMRAYGVPAPLAHSIEKLYLKLRTIDRTMTKVRNAYALVRSRKDARAMRKYARRLRALAVARKAVVLRIRKLEAFYEAAHGMGYGASSTLKIGEYISGAPSAERSKAAANFPGTIWDDAPETEDEGGGDGSEGEEDTGDTTGEHDPNEESEEGADSMRRRRRRRLGARSRNRLRRSKFQRNLARQMSYGAYAYGEDEPEGELVADTGLTGQEAVAVSGVVLGAWAIGTFAFGPWVVKQFKPKWAYKKRLVTAFLGSTVLGIARQAVSKD